MTDRDVLERNVESLLGSYDPPSIDPAARERIRATLVSRAKPGRERVRVSRFAFAGGALIAAAVAAIVIAPGSSTGPGAKVAQRDGRNVTLPDGSVAILDDGATIDPIGDRHVRVSGRVYLDVAPGKGTFTVDTAQGHLAVLGTRFVVDAATDVTTTAVVRGKVDQQSASGDALLHAGQQGAMRAGAAPTRGPAPRLSQLAGWARSARIEAEHHDVKRRSGTIYARQPNAPWTPDVPLPIAKLDVDVVVENQVARVAVDQTFHNPTSQLLEGTYRFVVPPDAALSRLAMYVNGELEESAVVERMQARRIYEDIVYRRLDPALAEWTGAGHVDLRVYPLPPMQDKRVITAYTQALPRVYDDWTLTVPLPDVDDPVGELGMHVRIADCAQCEIASPSHDVTVTRDGAASVVTYHENGAKVGDSLVLTVRDPGRDARVASTHDHDFQYALVRARPDLGTAPSGDYRPRKYVILDDVSASRDAMERRAQADLVDHLLDTIDEDDQVSVATMDVGVRRQGDFVRAADIDRHAVRSYLDAEKGGVGATDLGAAFDEAVRELAGTDARDAYVVYLGDGVVTGGARDLASLKEKLMGHATFVGFAVGDGSDVASMGALADATAGLVVPIDPADDLDWRALDAISVLYTPRVTGLAARVVDAAGADVKDAIAYLKQGELAEGDEVEVALRAPATAAPAAIELTGSRGGAPWSQRIELGAATRIAHAGYVPRLWAQRHIQALVLARTSIAPTDDDRIAARETMRKEIVELGKQYFLLSPHTSLLVLENDQMYTQYGVTKGKNDGWAPYDVPAKVPPATATQSLPDDASVQLVRSPIDPFYSYAAQYGEEERARESGVYGAIGYGRGGGGLGLEDLEKTELVTGEADPAGVSGVSSVDAPTMPEPIAGGHAGPVPDETIPAKAPDDNKNEEQTIVTTAELKGDDADFTVGAQTRGGPRRKKSLDHHASSWYGEDYKETGWVGQPYPVAWNYPADWHLDDLTGFVPGFYADAVDDAIAALHDAAGGAPGSIDAGARALIVSARGALAAGTYRWGDAPAVSIDGSGTMTWQITHETGLVENDRFDGHTFERRYDELGLVLRRDLGDAAPALDTTILPIALADPDQLAHWYVVTAVDDHTIALAPAHAPTAPTLRLGFDADHHLITITTGTGRSLLEVRWDHGAPVAASRGGAAVTIGYTSTVASPPDAPAELVAVEMPLRTPAYWKNRLDTMARGTDEWRGATENLMASDAATEDVADLAASVKQLADGGGLALGDLVLGSGGIARASSNDELVDLLSRAGDPGRTVGRYLSASRAYNTRPRTGLFGAVDDAGLVGTLAHHRETLAQLVAGKYDRALASLRVAKPGVLRVIAASMIAQYSYQYPKAAEAWDEVAEGAWSNVARYQAATARYNRGDYAGAATRFVELLTSIDPAATPVTVDWTAKSAVTSSVRGQVGWELAWSAYRNRVLDSGDYASVMTLLAGAMQLEPGDVDRTLGRAAELAAGDPDKLADIVQRALDLGQVDRAAPLVDDALAKQPTADLYRLAAAVAERQGRVAVAADDLDHALALGDDEPQPLSQVRGDLAHLLALRGRLAMLATGSDREAALDAATDTADRWREVDPDDSAIDQQIGEILLAGGRREEAWRQLSTAIERHPMEGDGWGLVADVMEKEGRLDDALADWQQAIVIDQTNPTWIMRKAQTLFALGRDSEARGLLEQVTKQHWHERWQTVVYQAQQMVAGMPK